MNKRDRIFITCILAFALIFTAVSISNLGKLASKDTFGNTSGGKARDVDMQVINRQIEDGRLSEHE
ncbi:MAG: hypothetical protein GY862_25625, partial [Gammaproteobacteria bacterium]|nr:hypothetical protein [Gammaproteobacteria bacterium]